MSKLVHYATAVGAGMVTYMLGGWDVLIKVVIVVIALDVASGILASKKEGHTIKSSIMQAGLWKRVGYLVALILAVWLDILLVDQGVLDAGGLVRNTALFGILLPEVKSVDENLGRLGVPLTGIFSKFLDKLKPPIPPVN